MKKINKVLVFIVISLVLFSCDKKVSVSPNEIINYSNGSVFISSVPPGAQIIVDGKLSGFVTPDTIKWLKDGNHDFTLKLEYFLDHNFSLTTENNLIQEISYNYYLDSTNKGSLLLESAPIQCSIFLDDSILIEKTPAILSSLLPKKYKIKFSYPEHRSDSTIARVSANELTSVFLSLLDTTIWVNFNNENSKLTNNTVDDIFVDENNLVWMATREGIIQNNGSYWNYYNTTNSFLPNNIVHKIKKDKSNTIWIATIEGLSTIVNNSWTTFTSKNSMLPGDYISDVDFDNLGNTWVATDRGLLKINGSDWTIYNDSNSDIQGNFITALAIDQNNNNIWIGTNSFGISRFDGIDNWKHFKKAIPPIDTGDSESNTFGFLTKTYNYTPDTALIGNAISALEVDNNGRVWAGFVPDPTKGELGGVEIYRDSLWKFIDFHLRDKRINDFYIGEQNQIWISTKSGLIQFKDFSDYKLFTAANSPLPTSNISAVYPNKKTNTLWIGTRTKGFVKFKNYLM